MEDSNQKPRVTIRDVANASGVSYATVSVVLNEKRDGGIRVSEQTRERIRDTARALGYIPNLAARTLKGHRKYLIAVFTYEKVFPINPQNEFYQFLVGIEQEAENRGYDLLILNNRPESGGVENDTVSRIFSADGAIMIGIDRDDETIRYLIDHDFPLVFTGRRNLPDRETNWVTFDYRKGIKEILHHFSAKGYTSIRYICNSRSQREPDVDRASFLREEAEALGFKSLKVHMLNEEMLGAQDSVPADSLTDCLVFDHLQTAQYVREHTGILKEINPVAANYAVLEDDWAGCFNGWTRLSSERIALGRATVSLLVNILDGDTKTSRHQMIPVSCVPGSVP